MQIPASAVMEQLSALHDDAKHAMTGMTQEQIDWTPGVEMNALGVLAAHICGVERYYLGVLAGGRENDRDRPAEFATTGVSFDELCARLDDSLAWCAAVVKGLSDVDMARISHWDPAASGKGRDVSGAWAVLMALTHVASHIGHMQITRDQLDKKLRGNAP